MAESDQMGLLEENCVYEGAEDWDPTGEDSDLSPAPPLPVTSESQSRQFSCQEG